MSEKGHMVGSVWLLCLLLLLATPFATHTHAAALSVSDQWGSEGSSVTYLVSIQSAPQAVAAMGFEIQYDPRVLRYRHYSRGSLVSNFDFFDANNVSPGSLRVGGFVAGSEEISEGDSGSVIYLTFDVIGHDDCQVRLAQLKDDIGGWSTRQGHFTGDHEEELDDSTDNQTTSPDSSSLPAVQESTQYNTESSSSGNPQFSSQLPGDELDNNLSSSSPNYSGTDTATSKTPSRTGQGPGKGKKPLGFGQKTGLPVVPQKQHSSEITGGRSKDHHPGNKLLMQDGLVNGRDVVEAVAMTGSVSKDPSPWWTLTGTLAFLILAYYLTIAVALLFVSYLTWKLIQAGRRRLSER